MNTVIERPSIDEMLALRGFARNAAGKYEGRSYAPLTVTKATIEGDKGIITGVASTPTVDRQDDIVEPKGADYALPLPLLLQHDSDNPIGLVTSAKVTKDGISITAEVALDLSLPEIERAWKLIKAGLMRGLSIGFRPLEYSYIEETGGIRFMRWEWFELSVVTIPANAEANIQNIKRFDQMKGRLATEARGPSPVYLEVPSSAGGNSKGTAMNIGEQIKTFENRRAALVAQMDDLVGKAASEGRTFAADEKESYATLSGEVKEIDEHLPMLRRHEVTMAAKATPVVGLDGKTPSNVERIPEPPTAPRSSVIEIGRSQLPKGIGFTRYVLAKKLAQLQQSTPLAIAKQRGYDNSSPDVFNLLRAEQEGFNPSEVVKATIAAGTTTDSGWASPLAQYNNLASEFVEYLRPLTIFGRLQGLRRIPFLTRVPRATAGTSGYWVGEGAPKPLSKMTFDSITMPPTKIASLVVITKELARLSSPGAEGLVRDDMASAIAQFKDQQAFSPGIAAVSGTNPASLTNGLSVITSATSTGSGTGVTVDNVNTDVAAAFAVPIAANINTAGMVWLMHPNTALKLSLMRSTNGVQLFPDITVSGGTFMGLPVIVSANVVYSTSGGGVIILISPSDILLAEDDNITIDTSTEASLQMLDNPTNNSASGTATTMVSMFQTNSMAILAEQFVNYASRRSGAVAYVDMVHY